MGDFIIKRYFIVKQMISKKLRKIYEYIADYPFSLICKVITPSNQYWAHIPIQDLNGSIFSSEMLEKSYL